MAMSQNQKRNNRSQGQRIRRCAEDIAGLTKVQEDITAVVSQHDRDIKMIKARLAELESSRQLSHG